MMKFEEDVRSFGDETPSEDSTGEQNEICNRKRKRSDIGSNASSKEKVSGVTREQGDKQTEDVQVPYTKKTRKRKSESWLYMDEFVKDGVKWARCKLCKTELKRGPTGSTTSINRHLDKCKVKHGIGIGLQKQAQLQFQPGDSSSEFKSF